MTIETSVNGMGGGAVTNYKGPFFRKGAQEPTMIFLYLSNFIVCRLTH